MTKREVVRCVLDGERPPYVPWSFSFTARAQEKLNHYYGENPDGHVGNHFVTLGNGIGYFTEIGASRVRDVFGVEWDRSVDTDIGVVSNLVLPGPTLQGYTFPDPLDRRIFEDIPTRIERYSDRFRYFSIGFSLFERAWTMRGMENLMMDFYDHPDFVHEFFDAIADYNLRQVEEALKYDIDAVKFGDDWGQQHGLLMGRKKWREFIYPVLKRMYGAVRDAGKYVMIHSCGDVDELFDDLIGIGLNCFNPFQPEVMDVFTLLNEYRGRLTFHGGLSTQVTLPHGTACDVADDTCRLIDAGSAGGYILSPAHAVQGDVPLENMLAFINLAQSQPGYTR